jgi:hypothetical protein
MRAPLSGRGDGLSADNRIIVKYRCNIHNPDNPDTCTQRYNSVQKSTCT